MRVCSAKCVEEWRVSKESEWSRVEEWRTRNEGVFGRVCGGRGMRVCLVERVDSCRNSCTT